MVAAPVGHQCPECVQRAVAASGQGRLPYGGRRSTNPALTSLVLIGLNIVLYFGLGGMLAWQAHLGGFLAGIGCGLWLENRRDAQTMRLRAAARRAAAGSGPPPD